MIGIFKIGRLLVISSINFVFIFALFCQFSFGQGKTIIERSLDKPVIVKVINGDTFLQRDLTDYLNLTLGTNDNPLDNRESDALTKASIQLGNTLNRHRKNIACRFHC
jgi:hypothetical protein